MASEIGRAQTGSRNTPGVVDLHKATKLYSRNVLGKHTKESESLVSEMQDSVSKHQSTAGHEKSCRKQAGPPAKAKYYLMTDSEAVP